MFSFICQAPARVTVASTSDSRYLGTVHGLSATESRSAPWCGPSSLICLTHITDCINKAEQSFDLKEIFSETKVCTEKSKWGLVKAKILIAGEWKQGIWKKLSTWKVSSSGKLWFFLPTKPAWARSPCPARARASLNSQLCQLSLTWRTFDSGMLPLASVAFLHQTPVFQGD